MFVVQDVNRTWLEKKLKKWKGAHIAMAVYELDPPAVRGVEWSMELKFIADKLTTIYTDLQRGHIDRDRAMARVDAEFPGQLTCIVSTAELAAVKQLLRGYGGHVATVVQVCFCIVLLSHYLFRMHLRHA